MLLAPLTAGWLRHSGNGGRLCQEDFCNNSPRLCVPIAGRASRSICAPLDDLRMALPSKKSRMVLRDLIGDVFRTLWAHKLRTFLTMFGIAWGIVSIVLMVAAGEGLRVGQAKVAETLGKDVMIVFHGRTSLQAGGQRAGRDRK